MRFIVFFNNHPKVQKFDVRAWDNAGIHPNFVGGNDSSEIYSALSY